MVKDDFSFDEETEMLRERVETARANKELDQAQELDCVAQGAGYGGFEDYRYQTAREDVDYRGRWKELRNNSS